MTNNLRKISQELRTFAKRTKDFKYTDSALILFLMTGMIFTTSNIFAASEESGIKNQVNQINSSINQIRTDFKKARKENNKLVKDTTLELIQLTEQGDHVVKSPWSSWQYGINYFNNNWNGTYKGRGDKKEKYPYEGIFERDTNEFNRYVAPNSNFYNTLSKSRRPYSASSNARQGLSGYGIASNRLQPEPIVPLELSAGITPRFVNKGAITLQAPQPATPTVPTAINFRPVTPSIASPTAPTVSIPSITPPNTGNGDAQWVNSGGSVAPLAQQNMTGGTLTVTANNLQFDVKSDNIKMVGITGATHTETDNGIQNFTWTGLGQYAAMKLVGGHPIRINGVTINYNGTSSTGYDRWLFHTDGHNDYGDSTWVLDSGTTVNLNGNNLVMYSAQYHTHTWNPGHYHLENNNIGFQNNGTITTTGSKNYLWLTLAATGGFNRVMWFDNTGTINLGGSEDTIGVIGSEYAANGGFSFINTGEITLSGTKQKGIVVNDKLLNPSASANSGYPGAEIILTKPIKITGTESVGVAFKTFVDLDGGTAISPGASTGNANEQASSVLTLPSSSRESVLNVELEGATNKKNTGLYFKHANASTNPFKVSNYTLKSTKGSENALIYIAEGYVDLAAQNAANSDNTITITEGSKNIGIYAAAAGNTLTTGAKITITDSDESTGIFGKSAGKITNTGAISTTGKSVKAIIASATEVESSGKITVNGTALSDTDGAVGLAAMDGGSLTSSGANSSITVDGSASIGVYSNGKTGSAPAVATGAKISKTEIKTTGGAFNTYAVNQGVIELGTGTTLNTGQKSLAFFTDSTDSVVKGQIKFTAPVTATIQGGTDSTNRGTAFYYTGTNYSNFGQTEIQNWVANSFNNTLNNLTLNVLAGGRLFIASNVGMDLSNTNGNALAGYLGMGSGLNLDPTAKSFMLYLSQLKLDSDVNLDDPTDRYNQLEISNSRIINNNSKTMTGSQVGQVAMAQENQLTSAADRNKVQLINKGTMNLSGANSTAMYGKFGELTNENGGTITMGDSSTALYGIGNSLVSNAGTITIGSNSTALYSKGATVGAGAPVQSPVTNSGLITSAGANAIGIIYDGTGTGGSGSDIGVNNTATGKIQFTGDKSVGIYAQGSNYIVDNSGEITLENSASISNPNVGIFTNMTDIGIANRTGGNITVGNNAIGTYGYTVLNDGIIKAGDGGVGIYSKGDRTDLGSSSEIIVGNNEAVGVYLEQGGGTVNHDGKMTIGDNSFGFVAIQGANSLQFNSAATANVNLGTKSIYVYSNDTTGTITNNAPLTSNGSVIGTDLTLATGGQNYGLYGAGTITNNAVIDFSKGVGNVGIYSIKGGVATNNSTITVGDSDTGNSLYSIGMAAGYAKSDTGKVINAGTINVNGKNSIGMYASGRGSEVENAHGATINLAAEGAMGIYLDNGARGVNNGTITTLGSPASAVGVVVRAGSELTNNGTINIDSAGGYAKFIATGGIVRNYGTITVSGGAQDEFTPGSRPTGKELIVNGVRAVNIIAPAGAATATITANDVPVTPVVTNVEGQRSILSSNIGMYIDTKRGTNPIQGSLSSLGGNEADLIIGAEAAETTTSKYIQVPQEIIAPYNTTLAANPSITNWNIYSGALTWLATATLDRNTGLINNIYLAKMPYTAFAGNQTTPVNSTDTFNFLEGLEQRYGVKTLGTREKLLFDKLNSIGKNEEILFYQATDEMMGHQYGNLQQRINATGNLLDKELNHLQRDWRNPSKQNNKIKVFGMRDEYSTDTAGIIDYTSNAYGVAYVHEDEKIKMGNSDGWYAGVVTNRFKFKDIGKSKENQTMIKAGVFKKMSPNKDYNGALQWTIGGDVFAGINNMERRYLVVDEIFKAKSDYHSYGAALKTDLGYDIRLSERTHFRPYGALKMEYGRFNDIKEDSGEMRLEVKGNDYFSVKPEVGMEFKFVQPLAVRTKLSVGLTAAYENELGKVGDVNNRGRVRYTTADWFGIRGEKDDRKGNGKFDLNIGVDNTRFGVTVNGGYDTKGKNVRAGIGFRAIY